MANHVTSQTKQRTGRASTFYIDGIRGLSALLVVLFHTMLFTGLAGDVEEGLPVVRALSRYGHFGVAVFIILAGYVLMLGVARAGQNRLTGGLLKFVKARARRIIPPYWAALALSLALIAVVPALQEPQGTRWDDKIPVTWGATLSHFFLVHDLSPEWVTKINGPMWSVAVEWQIYFAMPFLILPLWRMVGGWWATAITVAISYVPHFVGVADAIHPWFLGLFAIGMLAAHLTVNSTADVTKILWPLLAATLALLVLAPDWADENYWWSELLVGVTTATALIWMARRPRSSTVRFLQTRPVLALGKMSYSLYLIHSPLLALGNLLLLPLGLPLVLHYLLMLTVVVPLSIAAAYGFYLLVERHFQTSHQKEITEVR